MNSRRPGRVQKIAYDDTPFNARRPDIEARIGWLLAMSRLHHPDPGMADGRAFVLALGKAGCSASRSRVSRWESGEIPVSHEGMSGYEQALGLETGRISSMGAYLRAAFPGPRARAARPPLDPASREFSLRLDELVELAEDGQAQARDWQELGWHLEAAPLVHLRGGTWETLARQVVHRLPLSLKVAYRQYRSAAVNMASSPRAQEYLTSAVADYLGTPAVQLANRVMTLLDELRTPKAAEIILDAIEDPPSEEIFALAVWLAAQKLTRGDFSVEQRGRLDIMLLRMWRTNPVKAAEELAELIASLPEGLRSTLTEAASKAGWRRLGYVLESGEDLAPGMAADISEDIAEAARARVPGVPTYDEDRMLVRLVREGLFHRDSERRHLASLLVATSPFGDAVCDELLALLATPGTPVPARLRAATLTRYLSTDMHRLRMLRFVEDQHDHVCTAAIQAVGHMTFTDFSDQVIRASLKEEWSPREHAKMYALGMSGSPVLETLVRSGRTPEWQRAAARWWLAQGPAVRE